MSRELDFATRIVAWFTMVVLVALGGWLFVEVECAQAKVADREAKLLVLRTMQRGDVGGWPMAATDPASIACLLPDAELNWVRRGDASYLTFRDPTADEPMLAMGPR